MHELAPKVFKYLRHLDGYDDECLRDSLDPKKNVESIFKAGESQGKSGSFFFFSDDRKFIIKTMTDTDFSAFKKMFHSYVAHVSEHKNSILARIYGIYTILMKDRDPINLIVMGNTKRTADDKLSLLYLFDLKGSTVNRKTKAKKGRALKNTACLKDLNLVEYKDTKNQVTIWKVTNYYFLVPEILKGGLDQN